MVEKKEIKNNIFDYKLLVLFISLILFVLFFFLKLEGYFDFSSRYKIEWIQCYWQNSDSLLMIDGNKKSTWGIRGDVHFKDEPIYIKFKELRKVGAIGILNNTDYKNSEIRIFLSIDGNEFSEASYTLDTKENGEEIYSLGDAKDVMYIMLVKEDDESAWPISEMIIYD